MRSPASLIAAMLALVVSMLSLTTAVQAGQWGHAKSKPAPKAKSVEPPWLPLATASGLEIRVTPAKLALVKDKYSEKKDAYFLKGKIYVEVINTTDKDVVFEIFDVHNIAFVDIKTGQTHVLLHSCSCVSQCDKGSEAADWSRKRVGLSPGRKHNLAFDDFGCAGSMFVPPPPGQYDLYFRIRPHADTMPGLTCGEKVDVKETIESCRTLLLSDEFWKGSWVGAPVRVNLK